MVKKAKKAKVVRKTVAERIADACAKTQAEWYERTFGPSWAHREALTDFVRSIKGWPIDDGAVVALIGTDLKRICNMAISARTAKAIAAELERLGYK